MEKNYYSLVPGWHKIRKSKTCRIMRITLYVLFATISQVFATGVSSQNVRLSLNLKNVAVRDVLKQIEDKSEFYFMYDASKVNVGQKVDVACDNRPITEVLDLMFQKTGITYEINNRQIALNSTSYMVPLAQTDQKVTGKVTDSSGSPLPGVTVVVKGTTQGIITDADGNYALKAIGANDVLVFTFLGFETIEVTVGNKTYIDITLEENVQLIDEVVVTAMGIMRESKSLGYARQSVNTENITETRDANLVNMLSGKVAGLSVISGGSSSASTRIEIRGNNSITGNNQPLFVIDGVVIQNDMGEGIISDIDYGNIAANINPDDIENIEVLKGANAAALYGSDGANGAILITTKKGRKDQTLGINFSSNLMISTIAQYPEFQNVYGGGNSHRLGESSSRRSKEMTNMALMSTYNARSWGLPMFGFGVLGRNGEVKSYSPQPDNVYDFYNSGKQFTNNFSIGKSYGNSSFRFSYSNTNSRDVLKGMNKRERNAFSLRNTFKLIEQVELDASVRYTTDQLTNRAYSGWSDRNPMKAYLFLPRDASLNELTPWKDEDGNALKYSSASDSEFNNPYWALNECRNSDERNWWLADFSINIDFTRALKFRGRISADLQSMEGFDFTNKGTQWQLQGKYSSITQRNKNYQYEGILLYNEKLGTKFSLNASVGATWRDNSSYDIMATTESLIVHDIASLSNSAESPLINESLERIRKQSIFGAASLGFKDYLYLDITGRNDWNSTLPKNSCSFFYPSVSSSFILTDAFKLPKNVLSYGKLRASWSKTSNGTSFGQIKNMFTFGGVFNGISFFESEDRLKNSVLKPETNYSVEVGTELRFFHDRLNIDATYYFNKTIDQIIFAKVPTSTGFSERVFNAGELQNKGIEIILSGKPVKTENFKWDVLLNWSRNRNSVVSLIDGIPSLVAKTWSSNLRIVVEEGKPYGSIRGTDILYDEDGYAMIDPNSGRPYTNDDAFLGNVQPRFIGSISNTFKYKNFLLSFLIEYKSGRKLFSATAYHGAREGSSLRSLEFRDEYLYSLILGESENERLGINEETKLAYSDIERPKGAIFPGMTYTIDSETGEYVKVGPNTKYITPQTYWQNASSMNSMFVYDASFIKLRELSLGYTIPSSLLMKTELRKIKVKSVAVSLVGRNLWTIFQNTPKGVDPQATATSGNAQGLESGFSLPTVYYGFDFKISF